MGSGGINIYLRVNEHKNIAQEILKISNKLNTRNNLFVNIEESKCNNNLSINQLLVSGEQIKLSFLSEMGKRYNIYMRCNDLLLIDIDLAGCSKADTYKIVKHVYEEMIADINAIGVVYDRYADTEDSVDWLNLFKLHLQKKGNIQSALISQGIEMIKYHFPPEENFDQNLILVYTENQLYYLSAERSLPASVLK